MNSDTRLHALIDYLFANELRDAFYSQLDIAEILGCHNRAHLNAIAVTVEMSAEQLDKLLEDTSVTPLAAVPSPTRPVP